MTAEKFGKVWGFASIVITVVAVVFRPKKFSLHLSLGFFFPLNSRERVVMRIIVAILVTKPTQRK